MWMQAIEIFSSLWGPKPLSSWTRLNKILSRPKTIFARYIHYAIKGSSKIKKTLISLLHNIIDLFKYMTSVVKHVRNRREGHSCPFPRTGASVASWAGLYKPWDLIRDWDPVWFINTCGIIFRSSEIKAENHFLMLSIPLWESILKCRKYNSM